jgi:protease-4
MSDEKRSGLSHPVSRILLWLVLPLIAGILVSLLVPRPVIGVIYFRDAVYSSSASDLIAQFAYARDHAEIHAVVLVMDSPGGTVADSEAVYLELVRLRAQKPVVTLVENMAASGGYYIAVGSDAIIVHPSSEIGNVGVRVVLPSAPSVYEDEVSTGPYKFYGDSRDATLRSLDPIKQSFYRAVVLGRGDALKATPDEVLSGKLFLGTEAVRFGLADSLGTQTSALEYAAKLANIWNFKTEDLRTLAELPAVYDYGLFFLEAEDGSLTPYPREAGKYLLYIPSEDRRQP